MHFAVHIPQSEPAVGVLLVPLFQNSKYLVALFGFLISRLNLFKHDVVKDEDNNLEIQM